MAMSPNNHFPRAIPATSSRMPAAPAQPTAPKGRRPLPLYALSAVALVAISAAATAVFLNQTAPRPPQPEPAPAVSPAPGVAKAPPRVEPKPEPAAEQPAPKAPRPVKERLLEALGGMSAAQIYQGYLNIGLLADGVESEAYTKAEAEQMLATVGNLIDLLDRQLERVADVGLDPDDHKSLKRIQQLTVMLRRQASALRGYWSSGEAEQIARYHEARESTWNDLSDLLGLK